MADAVGFLKTSLDNLMSQCDVIVSLVPHTPRTEGMIGQRELDLIRSGSVLVNVSRQGHRLQRAGGQAQTG